MKPAESPIGAEAGLRGHLGLVASPDSEGRTVLSSQSFRAPFHIGKGYWDGSVLQVRVVNPTAGILEGDRLEVAVGVESGARLLMQSPAAARAFVMPSGSARCSQHYRVAPGAWLEVAPEPLFPHRDSTYFQTTCVEIDRGGAAYLVDSLSPGRVGFGEAWDWRRLSLSLEVRIGGEPVLRERLDCSGREMSRRHRLPGGAAAWMATAIAISPDLDEFPELAARVGALHRPDLWAGATRLAPGFWVARVAAADGLLLREALDGIRAAFAQRLPLLKSDLRRV